MMTPALREKLLGFFENWEVYKDRTLKITEFISSTGTDFGSHFDTTSEMTFELRHFGLRFSGGVAMFTGDTHSYEISSRIVEFQQPGEDQYEFLEQYHEKVSRKSILKFL